MENTHRNIHLSIPVFSTMKCKSISSRGYNTVYLFCLALMTLLPVAVQGASTSPQLADIIIRIQSERQNGEGSCGSPPWGVDHINGGDFRCHPPKYWFGYNLKAQVYQKVLFIPGEGSSWHISSADQGTGIYDVVKHFADGKRVCSPVAATAEQFSLKTEGEVKDGSIELRFFALPEEVSSWSCQAGQSYKRTTSLLLLHWAVAMTGDYTKLTTNLSQEDKKKPGFYQRKFTATTNPSPVDRDTVHVDVMLTCYEPTPKGTKMDAIVPCPWE